MQQHVEQRDGIDLSRFSLEEIRAVHQRIAPLIHRTPLLRSSTLGQRTDRTLKIKAENLQRTGSFKVRGALNALLQLTSDERASGVVTFSAGNHGQGLAYAGRMVGVAVTVFMAADAVPAKVEAIRGYGANIVFGDTISDAFELMGQAVSETGARFISPFADPEIIAGQATVGLEIVEDWPEVEEIVVPTGGGGLLAGVALAVKQMNPNIRVVGVEPDGANAIHLSLVAGTLTKPASITTIADGLAAPFTHERNLAIVQKYVDDVVLVSDAEIVEALLLTVSRCKLLVEPAGAAAVAALLMGRTGASSGSNTVAVLSGGNIDIQRLADLMAASDHAPTERDALHPTLAE